MTRVGIKKTTITSVGSDLQALLGLIDYRPSKDKILLKPNIVVAEPPESGAVTHPRVVEALVGYFRARGREVVIAEGTGIFPDDAGFERLVTATGSGRLRDELGVPILNLEQAEMEAVEWPFGSLLLPKLLREYEYINIPSMKTHAQTVVTLGVKNQKGLLPMRVKKLFHKRDLHSYIRALSQVLRPSLTIVDGIYCIEGTGPTGPPVGRVKRMDLLVAGRDVMAVDNVCLEIMGIGLGEVEHLRPVEGIELVGERIEQVRASFDRPQKAPFRVGLFLMHAGDSACTMCTVSFHKSLSKILGTPELAARLSERAKRSGIQIVMGQDEPQAEAAEGTVVVCIGDCSKEVARRKGFAHIPGCHPDHRKIVDHLSRC
jgi:uncharacterized protein (DUF362 family)